MGTIKVKLSYNYGYGPAEASQNYLEKNKTEKFSLPRVYQWELIENFDYTSGFGIVGQEIDGPGTYVGFWVCFSLNQTTGLLPIIDKTIDVQQSNGEITQRQRELTNIGLSPEITGSAITGQVYLDAAKNLLAKMNEINQSGSDLQLDYQFDLNTVPNLEKSTMISGFDFAPYFKTRTPVGSGRSEDVYQGQPAFFGTNSVWSDGNAFSFFTARYFSPGDREEVISSMIGAQEECSSVQRDLLSELQEKIQGPEEE